PLHISVEQRIHHDGTARVGKQLTAEPDEAAARYAELYSHPSIAVIVHVGDFAFARSQRFHNHADKLFRNVGREVLDRFHELAVYAFGDDFRLADHKLIAFAAHHLDENGELKFPAPHDLEGIRAAGFFHAQRDVGEQLFLQPFAQVTGSHIGALPPGKRRSVHGE